jgi:hypothetical protein
MGILIKGENLDVEKDAHCICPEEGPCERRQEGEEKDLKGDQFSWHFDLRLVDF